MLQQSFTATAAVKCILCMSVKHAARAGDGQIEMLSETRSFDRHNPGGNRNYKAACSKFYMSATLRKIHYILSESLIPAYRQSDRGIYQADHAVCLHKVSPLFAGMRIYVLGKQTVAISVC